MDRASFFILNIFLNSLLAFVTAAFLIEAILFLFRVREGRVAATLRIIPILKLPFDLLLYDFSRWSYLYGVNPFECAAGTRVISVTVDFLGRSADWLVLPGKLSIFLTVDKDLTFTLADLVGYSLNPWFLRGFTVSLLLVTAHFVVMKALHTYRAYTETYTFCKSLTPLTRKGALSDTIKRSGTQILTSSHSSGSPFATGLFSSIIYFPEGLSKKLSQEEFTAALAHEMEHIRYKDGLSRLALELILALFWWVPAKWLYKKILQGQEVACDRASLRHGVDAGDLISAISKSAKEASEKKNPLFAPLAARESILKRIHLILKPPVRFKRFSFLLNALLFGVGFFTIFLGRFWMF